METFGSLIDKLSIVNLKLYHTEDIAQEEGADDKTVANAKRKISILNRQRNALIEEIDVLFEDVIEGKRPVPKVFKQFKDYGKK
jgi:hypothetical protein